MDSPEITKLLPHPLPAQIQARLLLFAIRRMAIGGLDDAQAAHAFVTRFGLGFRRPLILLRATMAELSRVAQRRLALAPCCCGRTTQDEAALLSAFTTALPDARQAHDGLARTLAVQNCLGALTSMQAVAAAFEDLGSPLAR
ncbi:MAG: DUF6628 family protein [Rhizorhabdus sp.]